MTQYFGAITIMCIIVMVVFRTQQLKRHGIEAMNFGKIDKTDFIIPPFALFYFYLIFAAAFGWPTVSRQVFFSSAIVNGLGAIFCLAGILIFLWALVSFGRSFRVGIDIENPDKLITSGAFAFSRNPLYLAFGCIFLGEFLIFSNWIMLVYLCLAVWLVNRQVLREEQALKEHYGQDYEAYCQKVRRYL